MGVTLHLGIDDSVAAGTWHCGKSFWYEILRPLYPNYFSLDEFLTAEEQKLLAPEYNQYDDDIDKYRHINPKELKEVFQKVYNHLHDNHYRYPLTHMIWESETFGASTSDIFIYNGHECHLDGFHHDFNHRDEICLTYRKDGLRKLEWIKASRKVTLGDKVFYVETSNKFEEYKDILQELIHICDVGIKANRKLLWVYSN